MSLEIKGNVFFILKTKDNMLLCADIDTPIKKIKEIIISEGKVDNIELLEVTVKGEKWEIKGVGWERIALGLVK